MKLKKLDINGVGGIKKLELSFRDNVNVICGANGIGKTTILDIIKTAKFKTMPGEKSWNIPAWTIFTVKKITQKFFLANMKIENKKLEQSVEFIANVAGEVEFEVEEEEIETGHDDHNGNIDHIGNNSHNGHGHGNSSNAGGGIAGKEGE